jgi:Flp pilus assembly protein TadD
MFDSDDVLARAARLLERGQFADAAQAARDGLEIDPDQGRLWLVRAEAEFRLANYDLARQSLEEAALLVPLDVSTQCRLADCYARTGDTAHARQLLLFLVDDAGCPSDSLPHVAAGFGQLGDFEQALAVCRLATERNPAEAAPHFGAAYYLRRLGYPAAAIVPSATRAFELEPEVSLYRVSLALLLAESGRREEAYDLLRDLPAERCGCTCRLRRVMAVFKAVGDHQRWQECVDHLHRMRRSTR